MPKITFLDRLNSQEFDFTKNLSGSKIIKFGQSQALTSHFESLWSIVKRDCVSKYALKKNFAIFSEV